MNFLKRIALVLATGYVLSFYSERMFWAFWNTDDSLISYTLLCVLTWLVYSVLAYMFLALISYFRVRSIYALFLAGVAFGWIDEGIVAMTFFGVAGAPLPLSIVWTGVAWHALISVFVGWYLLQKSLVHRSYIHTISTTVLLGLFWALWGSGWVFETPPVVASPINFITYAFVTTTFLILALFVTGKIRLSSFVPTKWEMWALLGIATLYFIFITVPTVQILALILVVAFACLYWLLLKNKNTRIADSTESVLYVFESPASAGKYLCVYAMPFTASVTYIGLNTWGILFPFNVVILAATCIVGGVFLIWSGYKILK